MKSITLPASVILVLAPCVLAGPAAEEPVSIPDLEVPLCSDRLLGDVFGLRRPAETGIDFRLEATNFYHGAIDGDRGLDGDDDNDLQFGGKLDLFIDVDGEKAGLWPGLFMNIQGEFRYGDTTRQAGTFSPINSALLSPTVDGESFAFTQVTVTQALSESFLITLGKFNTVTLADKRFYGGRGVEGFMNGSLVLMPIGGRTFPITTLGAVATVLKDGAPFINFGIMDSISPETRPGWDGLSAAEMTFFADITLTTDWNGRLGTHTFAGSYSTIDASSLDQSDIIRPPEEGGIQPNIKNDSWQVNYLWEQSLTPTGDDPSRGWGTFLFLAVSDGDPNPFAYSAAAGLVANGVCAARPCDTFGVGVFYNEVSNDLRRTLENDRPILPSINIDDELGAEIFYDFAVTDWFRLGLDLQVVQPVVEDNDTAIFGGFRSRIIF